MEDKVINENLTITLEERIDSDNSARIEKEILNILKQHPCKMLILDAKDLQYISSSGLRVILRLIKSMKGKLLMKNVSSHIYEIFELTGFDKMINLQRQMRTITVEGCPVIGKGAFGTVYRLNEDTVVKVYGDGKNSISVIREETDKARKAFVSGIPTAIPFDIVKVGDQYGAVFEMIDAQNCNDMVKKDPGILDELIPEYAEFLKTLHSIEFTSEDLPSARDIYLENLSNYAFCFSEDVYARLRKLLEDMPRDKHLLHGDVQLKNVMISSGEIMVIDMEKICTGNPVFEFASLYASYVAFNEDDPEDTLRFMGISRENALRIYRDTLAVYLGSPDAVTFENVERKVRMAGFLRFLTILLLEQKDLQSPLKDLQVSHTVRHIEELVQQVEELAI